MNTAKKLSGFALATAAAGLFALAPLAAPAGSEASFKCVGGNACKGHSACKTATSACKGQNACKGQGFVMAESEEDCQELIRTLGGSPGELR